MEVMYVIKRDGSRENVSFDKVSNRFQKLVEGVPGMAPLKIDYISLSQKICKEIYSGVRTHELDELAAQTCATMITESSDYGILASRLAISNHHKKTSPSFSETVQNLYSNLNTQGQSAPLVTKEFYNTVMKHKAKFNQIIDYTRDYLLDYFAFKTLEKSYLLKVNKNLVERPQHLLLRVAIGIHGSDIKSAIECYNALSNKKYIHATPTLFNAGTTNGQLASCFLMGINEDSISGIYDSLKDTALISKNSGGIGIHIHDIRAAGSSIGGGTGISNGIVPMLRVFNNTAKYVDQGGGKRNGSFAIYLEPWHADINEFLDLRRNTGFEEIRARDLFYALWIPDLFMHRVETDSYWTLMCPSQCPGLSNVYGDDFIEKYVSYETLGLGKRVSARELWFKILEAQIETGTPYLLFKDACNKKSNQNNLGTIKSSNLCCEIIEYSGKGETAVCNLASLSLSSFVTKPDVPGKINIVGIMNCMYCKLIIAWCKKWNLEFVYTNSIPESGKTYPQICVLDDMNNEMFLGGYSTFIETYPVNYDYKELENMTRQVTRNLNRVIDKTTYPIESARRSNLRHRPIGIGVQGLSDVFMKMRIPFDSEQAKELNENIFETMYYAAVHESMKLAKRKHDKKKTIDGNNYPGAYATFDGSPLSKGLFQFDLWDESLLSREKRYDWEELRQDIKTYGVVNSLLISPMPTASSSTILGNNECFEPITSNIYVRRTLAGEFIVMNKHLQSDLQDLDLWNKEMKDNILLNNGSIQQIEGLPQCLKDCYKTVWEISQKVIIDLAADRGKYICQSQSMNLFVAEPTFEVLTSMFFYSWRKGLKTGCYYLRTRPQTKAQQFSIEIGNKSTCDACSG